MHYFQSDTHNIPVLHPLLNINRVQLKHIEVLITFNLHSSTQILTIYDPTGHLEISNMYTTCTLSYIYY